MNKSNKTKLFLAGTVAFSSVVAVGLPTQQAEASTITTASFDAERAANFSEDQKTISSIVQNHISKNVGNFINDGYAHQASLFEDLQDFMEPLTFGTAEQIKAEADSRIDAFRQATTYLSEAEREDLIGLAESLRSDLYADVERYDGTNINLIYDAMFESIVNNAPSSAALNGIFDQPTADQANAILASIQVDVDKEISGGVHSEDGVTTATAEDVKNNPQQVINAINQAETVTELVLVGITNVVTTVPFPVMQALQAKNPEAMIIFETPDGMMELSATVFDGPYFAEQMDVGTSELNIDVNISKGPQQMDNFRVPKLQFVIDYHVLINAPGKNPIPFTHFGTPVKRTIQAPTVQNAATTVGIRFDGTGGYTPVPTYIEEDGKTANLYYSSTSAYTLIQHSKTFADISGRGYWGEEFIEKLASKMIVNGKTNDRFSPSISITRGEFAAILARGLGLSAVELHNQPFSDVSTNQSVNRNGEIIAVVEAGIVQGYGNGKFGTYDQITRNEAAIMVSRAMDYIDSKEITLDSSKKVSDFADFRYISSSARPHVEKVYQAEYLSGFPKDNTFRSQSETTRAETAKILYNFLNSIKFIN